MRTHEETSGERARETHDASESRRWVLDRDQPEPLGLGWHLVIGAVLIALIVLAARLLH